MKNEIDLTYSVDREKLREETKTILYCTVIMDKQTVVEALRSDAIYIDGKHYKIPQTWLIDCLVNGRFGKMHVELEEIMQ